MNKTLSAVLQTAALTALISGSTVVSTVQAASETEFPTRAVRIIVPFSAGGSTDQVARSLAEGLGKLWQQPVVVENREGASGMIGARVVAEAKPDGYTLLFGTQTTQTVLPHLVSKMPYNPAQAFTPITELVSVAQLLSVPQSSRFESLQQFVDYAKSHPGDLTYGGGQGATTDMTMRLFMSKAGINLLGIPYKGSSLAMNDLLGGRIDSMFDVIMTSQPHVQTGRLRALAVTSAARFPALPNVPTVAEQGYPGFATDVWFALLAPAGTSADIVKKIADDSRTVLNEEARKKILTEAGFRIVGSDPATFAARMKKEDETWSRVVKEFNIKME